MDEWFCVFIGKVQVALLGCQDIQRDRGCGGHGRRSSRKAEAGATWRSLVSTPCQLSLNSLPMVR